MITRWLEVKNELLFYFRPPLNFGHANIITYANRPFDEVKEMDDEMIKRWNSVVKETDLVYYLGDFYLGRLNEMRFTYLARLNGNIQFVIPIFHHDKRWYNDWRDYDIELRTKTGICNVIESIYEVVIGETHIITCHYPFARWEKMHYGAWHLHGHSHGKYHALGKIYDVGVDNNEYYPISFPKLKEIMDKKQIYSGIGE